MDPRCAECIDSEGVRHKVNLSLPEFQDFNKNECVHIIKIIPLSGSTIKQIH